MLLRFISASPARTTLTAVSGTTVTGYALLAGADFGNASWTHEYSGPRGTQGARPAPGTPENRTVTLPIRVAGASKDDLATKLADLEQVVDELRRFGGQIQWQSNNATYRVSFDVMTATMALTEWGNRAEVINRAVAVVSAVCAPYAEGDPLDLYDDFTASVIGDYTFDAGTGTASIDNAAARMNVSSTAEKRFWHNLSGYQVADAEATVHFQAGSVTAFKVGAFVRRTAADTYLIGQIDLNGTQLDIQKSVAGVPTALATFALGGAAIVASTLYWLRFRVQGNLAVLELWTSVPRVSGTAAASVSYTLTSADLASAGRTVKGQVGFMLTPAGTLSSNYIDDLRVEPFTYRAVTLPMEIPLLGLPGSTDALADVWIHQNPAANNLIAFGLIGWLRAPREAYNLIWNGGFELGTNGWAATAVTGMTAAASSVAATGGIHDGAAGGRLVTPGSAAYEGVNFHVYRRFDRGRPYTFSAWLRAGAGAAVTAAMQLGLSGDRAVVDSIAVASSGAWVQATGTWYPTADRGDAYFTIGTSTPAAAKTLDVDAAMVYEGTTAPAALTQTGGRGAYAPLGMLSAGAVQMPVVGATITADATAVTGYRVGASPGIGAFSLSVQWRIDPSLAFQDDYQLDTVEVEVWARILLSADHTSSRVLTYAVPVIGATPVGAFVYTREYGAASKTLALPGAGLTQWTLVRLGTLPLPAGTTRRSEWNIVLGFAGTAAVGAKNIGVDCLVLLPARSRCLSPSGSDKASAGYPYFNPGGSPAQTPTRVVRSDLSGLAGVWQTGAADYDLAPAPGLGGSPIELPAGDVILVPVTYGNIPDVYPGTGDLITDYQNMACHVALTPRWGTLREP